MTRAKILEGQHLKTWDTEPYLLAQLIKDNGVPLDISDTQTVELYLKEANSDTIIVDGAEPIIVSDSNGKVLYQWEAGDTQTAATLVGEFIVYGDSPGKSTYPNEGTFKVYIEEGIPQFELNQV